MIWLCPVGLNLITLFCLSCSHPCDDYMRRNLALGKPANQSSSLHNGTQDDASRVVDGNKETFCQIQNAGILWWYVDLKVPRLINEITVVFIQDNGGLGNMKIEAGQKLTDMKLIESLNDTVPTWNKTFTFSSIPVRYVRIIFDNKSINRVLQIAEVEVYSMVIIPERSEELAFAPTFTSEWRTIKSSAGSQSAIRFEHNLQEYPIKVLVDVVVEDSGVEYYFTSIGATETDDDTQSSYGGVLCIYNDKVIRLLAAAFANNPTLKCYVVYTGGKPYWNGPNINNGYTSGKVRVRAWRQLDFPEPGFQSEWKYMNSNNDDLTYFDVEHNMNDVPDLVVVQVMVKIETGEYFVYEAQGTSSRQHSENGQASVTKNAITGCIFGFSNTSVRIWIPGPKNNDAHPFGLLLLEDGWGENKPEEDMIPKTGTFRITAWKWNAKIYEERIDNVSSITSLTLPFAVPQESLVINVEVVVEEGVNSNYSFYGVGSVSHNGSIGGLGNYQGVIYAHSGDKILFWTPSLDQSHGYIFGVGGRWGTGKKQQVTNNVHIKISAWVLYEPDTLSCSGKIDNGYIKNAYVKERYQFRSEVQIHCNQGYSVINGDNTRMCDRSCQWNNTAEVCQGNPCTTSDLHVDNATYVMLNPTTGNNITYTCEIGYTHTAGDLVRVCQTDGKWNGTAPNCSKIECRSEDLCANETVFKYTGLLPGDKVTYTCNNVTEYISGDLVRTCLLNGTWSGVPPYCRACPCKCVDKNENLEVLIKDLQQKLTVKKNTTSNFKRKLISVYDGRTSSVTIGFVGVVVMSLIAGSIILPDIMAALYYLKNKLFNE